MRRLSSTVMLGSLAVVLSTQVASAQCHSKGYGGGYSGGYGYSRQYTVYHPRVYSYSGYSNYGYNRVPAYQPNFGAGFPQQPPFNPQAGFNQPPAPFGPQGDPNLQPNPGPLGAPNGGGFNGPAPVPGNLGALNAPPIPRPDPQGPLVGSAGSQGGAVTPLSPNTTSQPKADVGQGSNSTSLPVIR